MTDEMRCPWCGSSDVWHLAGAIWVCRDCLREFSEDGKPLWKVKKEGNIIKYADNGWKHWANERGVKNDHA